VIKSYSCLSIVLIQIKKIELALEAFIKVCQQFSDKKNQFQLIVAGGYDSSVIDNVTYLNKLKNLATMNNLGFEVLTKEDRDLKWSTEPVVFLPDVSEKHKIQLLKSCLMLLYTPSYEHFGIVPVEAMLLERPVIAVNNGGLLETITTDKTTGFLCNPNANEFAEAMCTLINNDDLVKRMGKNGRRRVIDQFSIEKLTSHLDQLLKRTLNETKKIQ